MDLECNITDHDLVLGCIRGGLKAIDIAGYLNVNSSTITKIQSRKIKSFKPKLHEQLVSLYGLMKTMSQDVA